MTNPQSIPPPPRRDTSPSGGDKMQERPLNVGLDSRFVEAIMTGEMCLRGGKNNFVALKLGDCALPSNSACRLFWGLQNFLVKTIVSTGRF